MQGALGALAVAFVDDEDVGDFEQARFHRLDVVPKAWRRDHDAHVGDFGDVHLALAGADGFEQYEAKACRIEGIDHAHGSRRQAAEVARRRQRADINALIIERIRHAQPVAQDRATRNRARWIDRNDSDAAAARAGDRNDGVDEGRFASARRAGDADYERLAQMGLQASQQRRRARRQAFKIRDASGQFAPVARLQARNPGGDARLRAVDGAGFGGGGHRLRPTIGARIESILSRTKQSGSKPQTGPAIAGAHFNRADADQRNQRLIGNGEQRQQR